MKKLKAEYIKLTSKSRLHHCPNPLIGLTGGIATGKSTVSKILQEKGLHLICADALIHSIYKENETLNFIKSLNLNVISQNQVDFIKLRALFFDDYELKKIIETYLYKKLPIEFAKHLPKSKDEVIFYDAPILFEKNIENLFDQTIVVYSSRALQYQRVQSRDGTNQKVINQILNQQMDIEEKIKKANFVIKNISSLENLEKQVNQLIEKLIEAHQ